ncbi:hypothetical protein [Cytophaga aurantiaca]|uniref:hypothetical protein n=1 Tax=Cytophaga aurantiaca TaxID=29530 RepID=UPI000362A6A4|nr:hypothetical protein [Cytophaga aurantiaca]
MFDAISHVTKIFTDKAVKWTTKMFTFILICFSLWIANDTFDFINSYRTSTKLEHLEKITFLLSDSTLTDNQKDHLLKERDYTLSHRTKLDYLSSMCDSFPEKFSFMNTEKNTSIEIKTKPEVKIKKEEIIATPIIAKSYTWHYISSNLFLIMGFAAVPFLIFQKSKHKFGILLVSAILVCGILFGFSIFFAWILNFIPIIFNKPWINYTIDFIIQFILWTIVLISSSKN